MYQRSSGDDASVTRCREVVSSQIEYVYGSGMEIVAVCSASSSNATSWYGQPREVLKSDERQREIRQSPSNVPLLLSLEILPPVEPTRSHCFDLGRNPIVLRRNVSSVHCRSLPLLADSSAVFEKIRKSHDSEGCMLPVRTELRVLSMMA